MKQDAAYIYEEYIDKGPSSWQKILWNGLMTLVGRSTSTTLVDIVSEVSSLAVTAVGNIRDYVETAFDGVKSAGEYLKNAVLIPILDAIIAVVVTSLNIMAEMVVLLTSNFNRPISLTYVPGGISISGMELSI